MDKITRYYILAIGCLVVLFTANVQLVAAVTGTEFTASEMAEIRKKYGDIACNRIEDYNKQMERFAILKDDQKLVMVNEYLNKLLPEYDAVRNNTEEYWSTPKEFLTLGTGDCEDYVSIKYHSLINLGFMEETLFFAIVRDTYTGSYHMVLLYEQRGEKEPLVLDNLSFRILPLSKRTDLELVDFFNETGRYHYSPIYEKIPQDGNYIEFLDLKKRVESGE